MKRFILLLTLSLFYLAACTNSSTHSHDGETHTHENADHSHDGEADHSHDQDHSHDGDHDHEHDHAQEEFKVESDTLKQDSLKSQQ